MYLQLLSLPLKGGVWDRSRVQTRGCSCQGFHLQAWGKVLASQRRLLTAAHCC